MTDRRTTTAATRITLLRGIVLLFLEILVNDLDQRHNVHAVLNVLLRHHEIWPETQPTTRPFHEYNKYSKTKTIANALFSVLTAIRVGGAILTTSLSIPEEKCSR